MDERVGSRSFSDGVAVEPIPYRPKIVLYQKKNEITLNEERNVEGMVEVAIS